MLFNEPPGTQFDLRFTCLGIPVRVSPFFWVMGLVLYGGNPSSGDGPELLLWMLAVFVSILGHELGHALAARAFGSPAHITLGPMGGLAHHAGNMDLRAQLTVIAAGPGAGIALAAFVALVWAATGHGLTMSFAFPWGPQFHLDQIDVLELPNAATFVHFMLWINVFWTVMNLMPVYPLDGGQIVQRLLVRWRPWDGLRISWQIGLAFAGVIALLGAINREMWIAVLFGLLAYGCYTQTRGPWSRSPW